MLKNIAILITGLLSVSAVAQGDNTVMGPVADQAVCRALTDFRTTEYDAIVTKAAATAARYHEELARMQEFFGGTLASESIRRVLHGYAQGKVSTKDVSDVVQFELHRHQLQSSALAEKKGDRRLFFGVADQGRYDLDVSVDILVAPSKLVLLTVCDEGRLLGCVNVPLAFDFSFAESQSAVADKINEEFRRLVGGEEYFANPTVDFYLDHTLPVECQPSTLHKLAKAAAEADARTAHTQTEATVAPQAVAPVESGARALDAPVKQIDDAELPREFQ